MSEVTFTVPGKPVPFVRMTEGQRRHPRKTPAILRYLDYKDTVGWAAKAAGIEPIEGPVIVNIDVYLKDRMKRRWDIDNVAKAVLDGCNKVCFVDDKQVTSLTIRLYTAALKRELGDGEDEWTTVWIARSA